MTSSPLFNKKASKNILFYNIFFLICLCKSTQSIFQRLKRKKIKLNFLLKTWNCIFINSLITFEGDENINVFWLSPEKFIFFFLTIEFIPLFFRMDFTGLGLTGGRSGVSRFLPCKFFSFLSLNIYCIYYLKCPAFPREF